MLPNNFAACKRGNKWYVLDKNIWREATDIEKQFLEEHFAPMNEIMERAIQQMVSISFNMSSKVKKQPYVKQKYSEKILHDLQ